MAVIWFIFIIFPSTVLFTCIKSWFFRNHLANFHQISHWSFCWNVIDSLFKWSCSTDCQAHIFFKTKNCSNDDIFISFNDRIGKMLHNICMSAVAMSLRWANRGPWASCILIDRQVVLCHLVCLSVWWSVCLPGNLRPSLVEGFLFLYINFAQMFDIPHTYQTKECVTIG